ncbi:MAG: hypothetical protein M0Q45_11080 [Bacteroidales bacterium]|nr:hypothetical protein [Bacteroidales bacterium]
MPKNETFFKNLRIIYMGVLVLGFAKWEKWGFGGIFVAKQNKDHDKTSRIFQQIQYT